MIIRILGEGQYDVTDAHLDELDKPDSALQSAADADDEAAFHTALNALLDTVRRLGTPLPDEALTPSNLVLPDQDASLHDVEALLTDEGLIPG